MTVQAVQVAERRILRALHLAALIVGESIDDMATITVDGDEPSTGVVVSQRLAWARVSRLLKRFRGMITVLDDNNGPAYEISVEIVGECEEAIKEIEEQWRLTRRQDLSKKLADNEARLQIASATPRS
jgi:hypothetical protein